MSIEKEFDDDVALDSHKFPSLKLTHKLGVILPTQKTHHSYLLSLYDCLHNTLTHFCHLVSEFLDSIDNVYDLLAEYTSRVILLLSLLITFLLVENICLQYARIGENL